MAKKYDKNQKQQNKGHKTLRQKLKKKRKQLAQHKKNKKIQHRQYDQKMKKIKFFSQSYQNKCNKQLNFRKIKKYINKFIDIYQDNLEHFFSLFNNIDNKGLVDIGGIQNKQIKKILKKLFKYLPLRMQGQSYRKRLDYQQEIEFLIRNIVSEVIERYLQYSSDHELSDEFLNQENHGIPKKIEYSKAKNGTNKSDSDQQKKQLVIQSTHEMINSIGPMIPTDQRKKMADIFEEMIGKMQKQKQIIHKEEQNEFQRIISYSTGRSKKKQVSEIPEHLLAKGSAKIGQKVKVDQEQIKRYNQDFRPKKLIDEHKQAIKNNLKIRASKLPKNNGKIKLQGKDNWLFFDFKGRMTKPKSTNSFL